MSNSVPQVKFEQSLSLATRLEVTECPARIETIDAPGFGWYQ